MLSVPKKIAKAVNKTKTCTIMIIDLRCLESWDIPFHRDGGVASLLFCGL
jgi:hypothetical protein